MLPWDRLLVSCCTWKIFIPWLCLYLSSSSSHICLAVEQKRTLVAMSFLIEWSSQEMTITLHHSHCATKGPVAGLMHEPVTNPNLFLDTKETSQDLFYWPKFWPTGGSDDNVQLGWSEGCRKNSWEGSSATVLDSAMNEPDELERLMKQNQLIAEERRKNERFQ